jgi:predicted dehydrogenase
VCDYDPLRRARAASLYPNVETAGCLEQVLDDSEIEGVIVATPVSTHYPIARQVLEAGKSVLVEKPLATSVRQAAELVELARRKGQVLMVGHTFEYSAPVLKAQALIADGELGEVFYLSSVRANLGLFQQDVNVAWDLATHDVSIALFLLGQVPQTVSCQGRAHYRPDVEDVAMLTMDFGCGLVAFIHASWLDPNKVRRTTIVGSRQMLVYDDTAASDKIRLYDKGVSIDSYRDVYDDFQFAYRQGDIRIPRVEEWEPLSLECQHFIDCVRRRAVPRTDGLNGLRVVSVLEAAQSSLRRGGIPVPVEIPRI